MRSLWKCGLLVSACLCASLGPAPRATTVALQSAPDGAALYSKHCATCHGKDGRAGTFKARFNRARDLTDAAWQAEAGDERLFNSIAGGRGRRMPAFRKKLSEAEMEALVRFVRTLRREPRRAVGERRA
ncbi:MAG TPA: c-type cytochrome [Pyrinomonadaceae bacterium]|nr:c-type cytochrome [Pyrinomonadaceae bacterium]